MAKQPDTAAPKPRKMLIETGSDSGLRAFCFLAFIVSGLLGGYFAIIELLGLLASSTPETLFVRGIRLIGYATVTTLSLVFWAGLAFFVSRRKGTISLPQR